MLDAFISLCALSVIAKSRVKNLQKKNIIFFSFHWLKFYQTVGFCWKKKTVFEYSDFSIDYSSLNSSAPIWNLIKSKNKFKCLLVQIVSNWKLMTFHLIYLRRVNCHYIGNWELYAHLWKSRDNFSKKDLSYHQYGII